VCRVLVVPGVIRFSSRLLTGAQMIQRGFGMSNFGLGGDLERGCRGKTNCQMVVTQALLPPCSSSEFAVSPV
jgi:hypothetical protein